MYLSIQLISNVELNVKSYFDKENIFSKFKNLNSQ